MSILANDTFERIDGGLGDNWTTVAGNGAPQINEKQVITAAVGNDSYAFWSAIAWPRDQWAEVRLRTLLGAPFKAAGPIVRAQPNANTFYLWHAEGLIGTGTTVLEIRKCIEGSYTTLVTTGASALVSTNDILRLEVVGTTLVGCINEIPVLTVDDKSIVAGSAGIGVFSDAGAVGDAALDAFRGGDFRPFRVMSDGAWI